MRIIRASVFYTMNVDRDLFSKIKSSSIKSSWTNSFPDIKAHLACEQIWWMCLSSQMNLY